MKIDFVITWVNMDDAEWQAEFAKYSQKKNKKNPQKKKIKMQQ